MAQKSTKSTKAKSATPRAPGKPLSIEEYTKILEAAGSINGNAEDDVGGIAIVGIGPEPSTRVGRIAEFKRHLKWMARKAKAGDCYIVFGVKPKRRKADSLERFVQLWFGSDQTFFVELPNTTLTAAEADSLLSSRNGFCFSRTLKARQHGDAVKRFDPVQRDYAKGEEKVAADDMAYIVFDLWKLPVDVKIEVTAARAG